MVAGEFQHRRGAGECFPPVRQKAVHLPVPQPPPLPDGEIAILNREFRYGGGPAFAQGAVAGIATKLWLTEGRVLFIVLTPYAYEMEARLS